MNESQLRTGLLGAEPPSAALQQKFRERVRALTERRITGGERIMHSLSLLVSLAVAVWFVQQWLQLRSGGRPEQYAGIALGLAFSAGWSLFCIALLRRGTEDSRSHGALRTLIVVLFTGGLAGLMLWAGIATPDPARGNQLILFGLVFWTVIGLPFLLTQVVRHHALRIRLDVLRLELALAERDGVRS